MADVAVEVPGVSHLRKLGGGTSSVVYEGVQDAFARPVAVKVVHGQFDRAALERFKRECLAVGAVSHHPNIITVFDANVTSDGEPYLIMELFPRGSFAALLAERGPRPLDEVLSIGIALCGALETAHLAEVFHRDVKPENVLVGEAGEPVLADFGVAVAGAQSGTPELAFTTVHAAPEVLIDQPDPTTAADVYSLGSTLYELLAGAPAFPARDGEPLLAHYRRIAAGPLPPIPRGDVPAIAFEVLEAAMARAPEDRPTMLDLAHRMGEVQDRLEQVRTATVVLYPGPAGGPDAGPPSWTVAPEPRSAAAGTLVVDRRKVEEAPGPGRRSKAPRIIVGGAAVAATILVAAAFVTRSHGNPPTPPTTVPASSTPGPATTVPPNLIPTGVSVTATTAGHLEVRWAAPAQGPPLRYSIVYSAPAQKAQTKDVPGTATTASLDGAAPPWCVRVLAIFRSPTGPDFTQGQSERACA